MMIHIRHFWTFLHEIKQTDWKNRKKEVSNNREIKKSICGRKMPYDLFCNRRIRSWDCHHLHMNEEAIQSLQ